MKERLTAIFAVLSLLGLPACGQPGAEPGKAGEATTGALAGQAAGKKSAAAPAGEPPQRESALLAPGERRVSLVVLPGDAAVEISGRPVRRRDGLIDLTGKLGESVLVGVRKRDRSIRKTVRIEETGASPAVIDLDESEAQGATKKAEEKPKAVPYRED